MSSYCCSSRVVERHQKWHPMREARVRFPGSCQCHSVNLVVRKTVEPWVRHCRAEYTGPCTSGHLARSAHAGSRTRVTSMGGLYDAATLRALLESLRSGY